MYVRTSSQSGLSGHRGLGDAATVQAQIIAAANKYGVDPALALAVAKQESGYNQTGAGGGTLTSSAGALGVMQLMPATASSLGVDPNNQTSNIDGGVKLLSQLLSQFGGNVSNALAAYNAGPGNVQKYGGVPPFPETQNYVVSILANYQPGAASGSDTSTTDTSGSGSGFDLSSLTGSLPGSGSTYDLGGGVVLSGSDLFAVGLAAAAALVLSSIL